MTAAPESDSPIDLTDASAVAAWYSPRDLPRSPGCYRTIRHGASASMQYRWRHYRSSASNVFGRAHPSPVRRQILTASYDADSHNTAAHHKLAEATGPGASWLTSSTNPSNEAIF